MKFVRFALFASLLIGLLGCSPSIPAVSVETFEVNLETPQVPLGAPQVALMLARGGLGDKAFNDNANEGLQRAAVDLGVAVATFDYQPDTQEENMRKIASYGYNL